MKLLALGDVVSDAGCDAVRRALPRLKREEQIDFCIANGENSAVGNGMLPASVSHLFTSGVDVITGGNHSFRRSESYSLLDENAYVLRPYNLHSANPGHGVCITDMGRYRIGVINLLGKAFLTGSDNPFDAADRALNELADCAVTIVDFHAEATGEKRALGYYLDGRVSVVFGTHTHVQTADESILPQGTGYMTDLGMCGPADSVLGVAPELVIRALKTGMPVRFSTAKTAAGVQGCIFEIDEKTGKTVAVKRVSLGETP